MGNCDRRKASSVFEKKESVFPAFKKFFPIICFLFAFLFIRTGYGLAAEQTSTPQSASPTESSKQQDTQTGTALPDTTSSTTATATSSLVGTSGVNEAASALPMPQVSNDINSGAALLNIQIVVPPGRKGMQPNLALRYNSNSRNGWLGAGWDLPIGYIQRNTKFGVDYSANDFVHVLNGSSELTLRNDWGANYYGSKMEGAFTKYYFNTQYSRWEVTTKDGVKYFYGSSQTSRQQNGNNIFKWYLDKVQDTNGNYMSFYYIQDQGEIYIDRIEYAGNGGLAPSNLVKFYWESRPDAPAMYVPNFAVKTAKRLKTIEVKANNAMVRAYSLSYTSNALISNLSSVQQFGSDAVLDASGAVTAGTALPLTGFGTGAQPTAFNAPEKRLPTMVTVDGQSVYSYNSNPGYMFVADFNGDGKADYMWENNNWYVALSNGNGFDAPTKWMSTTAVIDGQVTNTWNSTPGYLRVADFSGDGKADYMWENNGWNMALSNGSGFDAPTKWLPTMVTVDGQSVYSYNSNPGYMFVADFNGDGKADYMWDNNNWYVTLSNGSGFAAPTKWMDKNVVVNGVSKPSYHPSAPAHYMRVADFNGDGKADYMWAYNDWNVALSTGSGFSAPTVWMTDPVIVEGQSIYPYNPSDPGFMIVADLNGDGKADYMWAYYGWNVALSTGSRFSTPTKWMTDPVTVDGQSINAYSSNTGYMRVADLNGDGKADYMWPYNGWNVTLSTGSGFSTPTKWMTDTVVVNGETIYSYNANPGYMYVADFSGDGKPDYMWENSAWNMTQVNVDITKPAGLLTSVSTPVGSTLSIDYLPSSNYQNPYLPFVLQTVSAITANDGLGNSSTTNHIYSGGLYNNVNREFRGFNYAKSTDPVGTTTETWFYQDDIFKGRAYDRIVKASSGTTYSRSYSTYQSVSPYTGVIFPYLTQADEYTYDGTTTYKQAAASFTYDSYGNVTRKYSFGDVSVSGDEKDEYIEYSYDTVNWRVSLPAHTYALDSTAVKKAEAWFTYDAKGNLLTDTRWLNGGTNPVVTYGYDAYGNRVSVIDPKGYTTTVVFDSSSYTYPVQTTNYLGHTVTANYDTRFGKITSQTDPNGNTTTYQYDVFGRVTKVTNPNDGSSTYGTVSHYYLNLGNPQIQRVIRYSTEQSGTGNYILDETYFDGLGRTTKTRNEGPAGKVIVQQAAYNTRGLKSTESLPYFEGIETPRNASFTYDAVGRVTRVTNVDNTFTKTSYNKGVVTLTDENDHRKVKEYDVYGRLSKVKEYTGTTGSYALYATTTYQYDILGSLVKTIDAANKQINISYDTLGRKISMSDPDMGAWTYSYDANGNLTSQKDAKNQTIAFTYDALNRVIKKDYPAGTDVVYTYDETWSTYPKGRLTTLTDASGTAKYYYDKLGNIVRSVRTIDGVNYTTETSYDALGRIASLKYPDNETVVYTYDTGGNLSQAGAYAIYANYNALGQAGTVSNGNGASTTYQYLASNNRLYSITTNSQSQGLLNKSYSYDNAGNVLGITDLIDNTRTQTFTYDHIDRLTQAQSSAYGALTYSYGKTGNILSKEGITYTYGSSRPHAVTSTSDGKTYTYDANGNMTADSQRTITYNYDNMPGSVTLGGVTTSFVYDGTGGRAKKTTPSGAIVYIGKLYECAGGVCAKYIFAGGARLALKRGTDTYYYHQDHLGSSNVITDKNGVKAEDMFYLPFGATQSDSGAISVTHKYTSQELDSETGLYYYGARYYNPQLGRFISPDSIVPDTADPQAFNRYSYVRNNPLRYMDPTGHSWLSEFIDDVGEWVDKNAKEIISGAIILTTGALTWYCGGCGWAVGALVGEAIGGYSAHKAGGDILSGVVLGGFLGGVSGALAGTISTEVGSFWAQVGKNFAAGAIRGAGIGAGAGYAGGVGDAGSMLRGALIGGAIGGALQASKVLVFGANVSGKEALQNKITAGQKVLGADFSKVGVRQGGLQSYLNGEHPAWTFGNSINMDAGLSVDEMAGYMSHELGHVAQYQHHGFTGFLNKYIGQAIEYGYWDAPLEQEARAIETLF